MCDTHPDMAIRYRDMLMEKSGEQRLRMGCSMNDASRQLVRSAILDSNPGITEAQMRRQMFLRFYGDAFSDVARERLFEHWARSDL